MDSLMLPFGKEKISLPVEDGHLSAVLTSGINSYIPTDDPNELVKQAIENPINSQRLRELAKGKKKITIIASDHTRPVPSRFIMPHILAEIRSGNPSAEITILIATGLHRTTSHEELASKFGEKILAEEHIEIHNCDDNAHMVHLGKLPSGCELVINKTAAEADLLVAEGFIETHFFAGFSGGRKSVLPGVA
ncbi:MAG: nickel-dependent lactate racemase, partial [Kiritimatiellae bacterium]|nr:nickel-dependent lactate racemase [Kiritimatiellia bacterium]